MSSGKNKHSSIPKRVYLFASLIKGPEGRIHTTVIAMIAALGGLLFGYDSGIISAALLFIDGSFSVGIGEKQVIAAAIVAGALVGCMSAGAISDRIGRKKVIILSAIIFALGSIFSSIAQSVTILVITRLILGFAVGAVTQVIPIYIAELAPSDRRGGLVVLFQFAVTIGILFSTIFGWLLSGSSRFWPLDQTGGNWRFMFLMGLFPALILLMGSIFLPESPRYLVLRGDFESAFGILTQLRPSESEARKELEDITSRPKESGSWKVLFSRPVRPALRVGMGIGILCQITGTNATIYYAPTILASAGFGQNAALATQLLLGITIMSTTLFGFWAVDHWGRRRLMLRFLPFAAISLIILGISFVGGAHDLISQVSAVGGLIGYEIFNVGSISVAVWLLGAEVFPLSVRGKGMSLVALSHWGSDLIVSLLTLSIVNTLGVSGSFIMFAIINIIAWIFVLFYVPETKGKSLEEIESNLREGHFIHMR